MDTLSELKEYIKGTEKIAVAYSGGFDSTLLLKLMTDILGENCIGVFVDSPLSSQRQRDAADRIASEIDAHVVQVRIGDRRCGEVGDDAEIMNNVFENGPERCYFCKTLIYGKVRETALSFGADVCLDGENSDDKEDERPGRRAAGEFRIRSPFRDLGIGKKDIVDAVRSLGLTETIVKDTCMATRIPSCTAFSEFDLRFVENCEELIRQISGVFQVRMRLSSEKATILTAPDEIQKLIGSRDRLFSELRKMDLDPVIDTKGYTG